MTASVLQKPIETVEWLTEQANLADAQSASALKAVESFANQIRNNKTPENLAKFHALLSESELAVARGTEWRQKLWEAQVVAYKSKPNPAPTLPQRPIQITSNVSPPSLSTPASSRWAGRTRADVTPPPTKLSLNLKSEENS